MQPDVIAVLLTVPGSLIYITAVMRKFFSFTQRLEETLKPDAQGRSISERLDDTQSEVKEIRRQVLPNGGSSLRDAVNDAAILAKVASDNAGAAVEAAKDAADQASRAEIMGNFERREIRHKLETIDSKIDSSANALNVHLVDAAAKTETMNNRLDTIEKKVERSA